MATAVALEDARNLLEAASARVLSRLEATGGTDVAVGMRTAGWLAWEADGSREPGAGSRGRRDASAGSDCSKRHWWSVGCRSATSRCSAVANARNRHGLSAAQQSLVDLAARFPFEQWCRLLRRLAADLDQDGSYDPNEDLDANRLRVTPDGDGTATSQGV
ncbi:MAG: hypothetical protein R2789_00570 [Microthrixaceae bacterium]